MKQRPRFVISSASNPRWKSWKQLKTAKGRKKQGRFLIEGMRLVEEASVCHQSGGHYRIEAILLRPDADSGRLDGLCPDQVPVYELSGALFDALSDTVHSQGVLAVIQPREQEVLASSLMQKLANLQEATLLLLDAVSDPGNLGTLIRSADALGATGVILGQGCVDLYNEKVVRATMGSLFHLPVVQGSLEQWIPALQEAGVAVYCTTLGGRQIQEVLLPPKVAFVLGNEAHGVAKRWQQMARMLVTIPMVGEAESLNVGVAGSLLLYERLRRTLRKE